MIATVNCVSTNPTQVALPVSAAIAEGRQQEASVAGEIGAVQNNLSFSFFLLFLFHDWVAQLLQGGPNVTLFNSVLCTSISVIV